MAVAEIEPAAKTAVLNELAGGPVNNCCLASTIQNRASHATIANKQMRSTIPKTRFFWKIVEKYPPNAQIRNSMSLCLIESGA